MKLTHIIQSLTESSGVTTFAYQVAFSQTKQGHDVSICCQWQVEISTGNIPVYMNPKITKILAKLLESRSNNPKETPIKSFVHIHGLWSLFCLRAVFFCVIHNIPYIVSPHGGLMPRVFTKGRIKKFIFWHVFLKPLLKRASAIHCTAEAEVEACKALGLKGPFVIAPLGVHLPQLETTSEKSLPQEHNHTILFLGRLGEEKGLLNLLGAWKRVCDESYSNGWCLKIAGPDWLDYKKVLDAKIMSANIAGVMFTGSADAAMKDKLYREADIFVLPSPMENFSMVVLEALAYGVPAIATKGTPWSELESKHCGLWIDQGEDALFEALSSLMKLSDSERHALGANGRALAASKYQWPAIAQKLLEAYQSICNKTCKK